MFHLWRSDKTRCIQPALFKATPYSVKLKKLFAVLFKAIKNADRNKAFPAWFWTDTVSMELGKVMVKIVTLVTIWSIVTLKESYFVTLQHQQIKAFVKKKKNNQLRDDYRHTPCLQSSHWTSANIRRLHEEPEVRRVHPRCRVLTETKVHLFWVPFQNWAVLRCPLYCFLGDCSLDAKWDR